MPFSVPQQVGEMFDIGIELRDPNVPIVVKNRNGDNVSMSQVGFVVSTNPQTPQEESTELQRKSQLVQLGDKIIDREFDQQPQHSDGDWSGGLGQRVEGQGSDQTRYWDGLGILWPVNDWQPQVPFIPPAFKDAANTTQPTIFLGSVAGWLDGQGVGYAFSYTDASPAQVVIFRGGSNGPSRFSTGANVGGVKDMVFGHGVLWTLEVTGGNIVLVMHYMHLGAFAQGNFANVVAVGTNVVRVGMACGNVGNQQYISVIYRNIVGNFSQDTIKLYNLTSAVASDPPTFTSTSFVTLPMPAQWYVNQTGFLGDDMIVSATDGMNSILMAYNIATQAWRTLSNLPGATSVYFTVIGGGLFLLVNNQITSTVKTIDLYLLQGLNLQHVVPLLPQLGSTTYPFVLSSTRPTAFGPYAIWAIMVQDNGGGTVRQIIYAFDVLRGRLFKVATSSGFSTGYATALDSMPIAAYAAMQRNDIPTFNTQWGLAINVTDAANGNNIQEYDIGVTPSVDTSGAALVGPVDLTSGLIDFTSSQPKLYQQVIATFTPLKNDAGASVKLNAWLDQDPGSLPAPTLTAQVVGNVKPLATVLTLPINQVARKLVYEAITTGGIFNGGAATDANAVNAPKLISVAVQAISGWVWHLFLLLARQALVNTGGNEDYAYTNERQSPVSGDVDEVACYNWIKQVWRLYGGNCKITMANGDSYNAKLQVVNSRGSKPFGSSTRSDQPSDRIENIIEVRIREDV